MTDIVKNMHGNTFGLSVNNDLVLYDADTGTKAVVSPAKFKQLGDGAFVAGTGISSIVKLTQAAYDALSPPVSTTLYVIVG